MPFQLTINLTNRMPCFILYLKEKKMLEIKENTLLIGVSELRTKMDQVIKAMGSQRVIIEKRRKPIAAMVPMDKYEIMLKALEVVEDMSFGHLAKERHENSSDNDYLDLLEAIKKIK